MRLLRRAARRAPGRERARARAPRGSATGGRRPAAGSRKAKGRLAAEVAGSAVRRAVPPTRKSEKMNGGNGGFMCLGKDAAHTAKLPATPRFFFVFCLSHSLQLLYSRSPVSGAL